MRNLQLTETAKAQNLTASQIENSFFHAFRDIYRAEVSRQNLESGKPVTVALPAEYFSVTVSPFTSDEFSIALFYGANPLPVAYAYCDSYDA